jgi:hypothetical protein
MWFDRVDLGYRTWRVERAEMSDDGECDKGTGTIRLKEGQTPAEELDTVLHEFIHAILYDKGSPLSDKAEEVAALVIAHGLTELMIRNKGLTEWMVRRTEEARCEST